MKVALCLSGQSRTFKKCFKSQKKHIIDRLNPDIFIHTWTFAGNRDIHATHNQKYDTQKYQKYVESFNNITSATDLIKLYKPKKILIEHPNYNYFIDKIKQSNRYKKAEGFEKLFDNDNKYKWFNLLMMYYSIFMSNQLKSDFEKEVNINYDLVIRSRMDLYFNKFLIDNTLQLVIGNVIFLPPNQDIDVVFNPEMKQQLLERGPVFMPNDKLAYGNTNSMNYYSSAYTFFEKDVDFYPHHGEAVLSEHLWYKNVSEYKNIQINKDIQMRILR